MMADQNQEINTTIPVIALVNCDESVTEQLKCASLGGALLESFKNGIELLDRWEKNPQWNIIALISQSEVMAPSGASLLSTLKIRKQISFPFFILCRNLNEKILRIALQAGIAEAFRIPFSIENFELRFNFIVKHWPILSKKAVEADAEMIRYKTPLIKRVFDIVCAGSAMIILSPLFIIVGLLIKLESPGPIFYYALRVGRGYHIFKFYKFRSMYFDADKRLKDLKHLNQYTLDTRKPSTETREKAYEFICDECRTAGTKCQFPIYSDTVHMCEKEYMHQLRTGGDARFIKIKDDPRMTRIGKFIRRTSIDELPQLYNVLIGDMSIVGNRPLPLYEAEKLTTDKYALRFIAPAGITGLWQVMKRGKGKMSEEERLLLDNIYAKNNSFYKDILLILRTIPALFQKENV